MSVLQGEIYVSSIVSRKEHSEYLDSSGDVRVQELDEKEDPPKERPRHADEYGLCLYFVPVPGQ